MDLRELPDRPFRRHPWETARARFFSRLVVAHAGGARPLYVLDVGAGDGYLARRLLAGLPTGSRCLCVDAHYTEAHLARLRAEAPSGLSFAREPGPPKAQVLMLLDVLEHVEDDAGLLVELVERWLSPGALAVLSVPAFMQLYSQHDAFLGHHRRYRASELRSLASRAGLEVVASGGLFHSLLPVRALQKLREELQGQRARPFAEGFASGTEVGAWSRGRLVTGAVNAALSLDNAASRLCASAGLSLPGLSTWLVGRKP